MGRLLLCLAAASFCFVATSVSFAQPNEPDYNRAYMLATAAYCSYAASELELDRGQARAVRCLKAAARDDKLLSELLGETPQVEVYVDPNSPENAYLLARVKAGVLLAFRGTLTPPIDPKGNIFQASADSAARYNTRALSGLRSFITDWLSNTQARVNTEGRHAGFDRAWQSLRIHLQTACATGGSSDCSSLSSFIAGLNKSDGEKIYITGHSKGGALATLAALDIPQSFSVAPITYVFSAAKVLSAEKAEHISFAPGALWRFERSDDIVPTLPPDRSFVLWQSLGFTPYAHLGDLVLFDKSAAPRLSSSSVDGIYQPTDTVRISDVIEEAATSPLRGLLRVLTSGDPIQILSETLNLGENGCRKFVDSHFKVFADVQAQVSDAKKGDQLFIERLSDNEGDVLWGYRDWCTLVQVAQ
jgi:hypothetical protein